MKPTIVLLSSPRGHFSPIASGAISTWLYEVAREAQKDGVHPIVIARRASQQPYEEIDARFIDYPAEPTSGLAVKWARFQRKLTGWPHFGQALYAARVADLIRRDGLQQFPLFLSNDPELAVYLRSQFADALIIHHFHNQMTIKPRWKAAFQRSGIKVSAVSDFTRRFLAHEYALPFEQMKTIYNGVDSTAFTPRDGEAADEIPVLNFVGRTGIEKGADLLLEAALILADESKTPFGVQIVGANTWEGLLLDNYQKKLMAMVGTLENRGVRVHQTGHVNRHEVPQQFHKAHIHVVPSRWDEPFGLTTVEGMASGLATIASNTGGSPEIVNRSGFLFARDDAQDLARKIRPLLEDTKLRHQYGQKARQRALDFSWENTWRGVRAIAQL